MDKKRYRIVITEIETVTTVTPRQWVKGGFAEPGEPERGFGYTPQVPDIRVVEREAYTQNTDTMDLVEVIKAVNGILKAN